MDAKVNRVVLAKAILISRHKFYQIILNFRTRTGRSLEFKTLSLHAHCAVPTVSEGIIYSYLYPILILSHNWEKSSLHQDLQGRLDSVPNWACQSGTTREEADWTSSFFVVLRQRFIHPTDSKDLSRYTCRYTKQVLLWQCLRSRWRVNSQIKMINAESPRLRALSRSFVRSFSDWLWPFSKDHGMRLRFCQRTRIQGQDQWGIHH